MTYHHITGYIKNGFCSDSRINMGILHQKLLYQFLGDPSYHQLIADIQKGIVAKCNSDLRRKIYPACRKMITRQCSNSIQNYITPIRNAMLKLKSQETPLLIDSNITDITPGTELRVTDNVIGYLPHKPLEATDDPRKRKSDSTNTTTRRRKVKTKNVEQNVECILGDTQLPNLTILTCNEVIHNFLEACGCDKCFEKLTKHKYNTLKNKDSYLCKICTKFFSFDAMYPHT